GKTGGSAWATRGTAPASSPRGSRTSSRRGGQLMRVLARPCRWAIKGRPSTGADLPPPARLGGGMRRRDKRLSAFSPMPLSPGSGKGVERSVPGLGYFGKRMTFLEKDLDQGGLAGAVGAERAEPLPSRQGVVFLGRPCKEKGAKWALSGRGFSTK